VRPPPRPRCSSAARSTRARSRRPSLP
jgi:hypothetical protein